MEAKVPPTLPFWSSMAKFRDVRKWCWGPRARGLFRDLMGDRRWISWNIRREDRVAISWETMHRRFHTTYRTCTIVVRNENGENTIRRLGHCLIFILLTEFFPTIDDGATTLKVLCDILFQGFFPCLGQNISSNTNIR